MEKEILNLIKSSKHILLITHINPDGDTLGCASALKSYIGERADILLQIKDNFNFPSTYSFLPEINKSLNFSNLKNDYDLVISLDCASIDRIVDSARKIFDNSQNTISFDHHKTNNNFAKLNLVRGGLSSTAEVLYDFFKSQNIEITPDMTVGLYAGVLTDTGCFKYESTTSNTFKMAADLSKSINTSEIADLCYTNKAKNMILFQSELVANAKFSNKDKIAYTLITREIQEKYGAKDEYTEGIVETLRSISNVEIAFVLKETNNGVKVSIRTKSIDATIVANRFNGGGHKRAAGCTIKEDINKACELLILEAQKQL